MKKHQSSNRSAGNEIDPLQIMYFVAGAHDGLLQDLLVNCFLMLSFSSLVLAVRDCFNLFDTSRPSEDWRQRVGIINVIK